MFGYPSHDPLSQACEALTRSHIHEATVSGERVRGVEQALLDQLSQAIASSTGAGSGGGSGLANETNALNTAALELQRGIQLELTALRSDSGQSFDHLHASDEVKVEALVEQSARTEDVALEARLLETFQNWIYHIRDTLNPPKITALRGRTCPNCKQTHYWQQNEEGVGSASPALQVNLSAKPPIALCQSCGSTWAGGELLDLGAYTN